TPGNSCPGDLSWNPAKVDRAPKATLMPGQPGRRRTNGQTVDSAISIWARSLDARVPTEPPDRYRSTPRRDEPDPAPERRGCARDQGRPLITLYEAEGTPALRCDVR